MSPCLRLIAPLAMFLVSTLPSLRATAQAAAGSTSVTAQQATGSDDPDRGAAAVEAPWLKLVREALVLEKFDELDKLAEGYRTQATRMAGGDWTLHVFFQALNGPHEGDTSMPDHLLHLQHWIAARPQSVTAAVAYADSLHRWAWQARGNGSAESVSVEAWMKFGERLADAQKVLDAVPGASTRTVQDPQWFSDYMTVALGLNWDNDRVKALFEKGSSKYPGYFYLYKQYANYLLPKWDGKPGDAAQFASETADRIGGAEGDQVYYQIGTLLLSRANGSFPHKTLDWPRLQRGHASLAAKYGSTRRMENEFGLMAYRAKDAVIAQQQFAAIGDKWSRSVWRDRTYFDRARDWAGAAQAGAAPSAAHDLIPMGPQ